MIIKEKIDWYCCDASTDPAYNSETTTVIYTDKNIKVAEVFGTKEERHLRALHIVNTANHYNEAIDVLKRLSSFEFKHQGVAEGPLATILEQAKNIIKKGK